MKTGHLQRRSPRKNHGFSWARVPLDRCDVQGPTVPQAVPGPIAVSYRLFLRDSEGKCHAQLRTFHAHEDRRHLARMLRGMRAQLRWVVDQLEFARLGLEDPTPCPRLRA